MEHLSIQPLVTMVPSHKYNVPLSIRRFAYKDIQFNKKCILGMGTFGKCVTAQIAHLNVCAKVFKTGIKYKWSFPTEIFLLEKCCHENLPWIYGIVHDLKIIITSLHTFEYNRSITVHSALHETTFTEITATVWKK